MTEEIKEILFQLEIVARKHTIKVLDDGNIETMPASVVDELRLNNYSAKILLNYITNLQKENEKLLKKLEDISLDEANIRADILLEQQDYKSRNEKGLNKLITLIQIIGEQPSKNVEEDNWLLNKLESIQIELQGGDE